MDNRARMAAGLVYDPGDPSILGPQGLAQERLWEFNHTRPSEGERRTALLAAMFASVGPGTYLEPPVHANWGGAHVHLGARVYANSNLTLVDDGEIRIGDHVMLGPDVVITTAGHPVEPGPRRLGAQFNQPVTIGDNVWVGSGVQIMPGVTIGADTVVGAGSVVTRDLPAGVVALGVPCRVVRQIDEHDRRCYWRDRAWDVPVDELVARLAQDAADRTPPAVSEAEAP